MTTLDSKTRKALATIAVLDVVRELLRTSDAETVDGLMKSLTDELRFGPGVFNFTTASQCWIDGAPYSAQYVNGEIVSAPSASAYL